LFLVYDIFILNFNFFEALLSLCCDDFSFLELGTLFILDAFSSAFRYSMLTLVRYEIDGETIMDKMI